MADRDQAIALRVAPTLRLSRISEREPVARSGPTVKPTRPELEAVAATSPMPEQSGNLLRGPVATLADPVDAGVRSDGNLELTAPCC